MMNQGGTPTTTLALTAIVPLQSNDSAATEAVVGAFEGSEEMNVRGVGGNRWSQEETLALLKIRSDLDTFFRDNIYRRPLWSEVSRKMRELGYIREGNKCKDKFQKLHNYYKRTKEIGKTCRFFDQLKAFETLRSTSSQQLQPPAVTNMMISTLPSSSVHPHTQQMNVPSLQNISRNYLSDDSSCSNVKIGGTKELIERYMKQVLDKQEEFFEAFDKREQERIAREESWRAQEIAKFNRDYEIIAQERSMLAAKDASLVALLQKLSENLQNQPTVHLQQPPQPFPQPPPTRFPQPVMVQPPQSFQPSPPPPPQAVMVQTLDTAKTHNGDQDMALTSASTSASASSSQWPKAEIKAFMAENDS